MLIYMDNEGLLMTYSEVMSQLCLEG
uniref:Uncharacterized protein n=1 Tax=Arundo donax TaxID=35708 RepID=A0A0A9ALU6_ARUDO